MVNIGVMGVFVPQSGMYVSVMIRLNTISSEIVNKLMVFIVRVVIRMFYQSW
jgi:hypothetical protein